MEWAKLLSTEKLSSEPPEPDSFKEYPINAFEKDYSRIVSSAAFRRLQDKTQVFPLDKSDFIRTRLTHSIEVSTIARLHDRPAAWHHDLQKHNTVQAN